MKKIIVYIFMVLMTCTTVFAADQVVTNNSDSGSGSLRQAIADVGSGETITFADDYTITLASELTIDKSLTITGTGEGQTIIQANANPNTATYRVFYITGTNVTLENMTIRNGNLTNGTQGGGIFISETTSTVNINNSSISNNSTNSYGGGISVYGTLNLLYSTVSGNEASGAGGIYSTSSTTIVIVNSTISSNIANGSYSGWGGGGGIFNGGMLSINNATINSNTATIGYFSYGGGGIYNAGAANIENSTVYSNTAGDSEEITNAYGGGIYHSGSSNVLTIVNSTIFYNNSASDIISGGEERGGGIYVASGTSNILNSIIINNELSVTGSIQDIYNDGTVNSYFSWYNNTSGSIEGTNNTADNYSSGDIASLTYSGGFTNIAAVSSAGNATGKAGSGTYSYYNSTDGYYYESSGTYYKIAGQADPYDPTSFTPSSPSSDQILSDQRGYYRTSSAITRGAYQYDGVVAKIGTNTSWTASGNYTTIDGAYNAASSDDIIELAGTAICESGIALDESKTVTIRRDDALSATTYIQASQTSGTASDRVFKITDGYVTLNDMTIRYGNVTEIDGGGIWNQAELEMNNCIITGNTAAGSEGYGGAFYNHEDGVIEIGTTTISGNTAYGCGAINNHGIMNIWDSTISQNTTEYYGGGFYDVGEVNLYRSTVNDNTCTYSSGGGIFTDGYTTLENSTVSGNLAGMYGGGIYSSPANNTLDLKNCTIAGNHSDYDNSGGEQGGGLTMNGGTLTVSNTIIADNFRGSGTATGDDYYYADGTLTDNGYNIVEYSNIAANATGGFNHPTDILYNTKHNESGTSLSSWTQGGLEFSKQTLYLSSTLALNNNPNGTYTLTYTDGSSIGIDDGTGSDPDQRCAAVYNGTKDIGAYEWEGSPGTLPVELSAFTAQFIENMPTVHWSTQSETDNMGWLIYRNEKNDFSSSEVVSDMIDGYGTTTQQQFYTFEDDIEDPEVGDTYYYWLESIDYSGIINHYDRVAILIIPDTHGSNNIVPIPERFGLFQNEPNPMISTTRIAFNLHETAQVELSVYNLKGQLVKKLYSGTTSKHTVMWDCKDEQGKELESGVYFYTLILNGTNKNTMKMILIK
jgi:hypothetical protein